MRARFRSPLEEPVDLGMLYPTVTETPGTRAPAAVGTRTTEERLKRGWPPKEISPPEPVPPYPIAPSKAATKPFIVARDAAETAYRSAMKYADGLMVGYTAAVAKSEITGGDFREFKMAVTDLITKAKDTWDKAEATITSLNKLNRLVERIKAGGAGGYV